jgi:hypothetical protein
MLGKLREVSDFLAQEKDLLKALNFISVKSCPSGERARLLLFRIGSSSRPICIYNLGFKEQLDRSGPVIAHLINEFSLTEVRDPNFELREHNDGYHKRFHAVIGLRDDVLFLTTVIFRLPSQFCLVISLQVNNLGDSEREYFQTLGSIFSLYLRTFLETPLILPVEEQKERKSLFGVKLSERQDLILEMLIAGLTNFTIAKSLGYSESLIRQETVTIYRKLGVKGRGELRK